MAINTNSTRIMYRVSWAVAANHSIRIMYLVSCRESAANSSIRIMHLVIRLLDLIRKVFNSLPVVWVLEPELALALVLAWDIIINNNNNHNKATITHQVTRSLERRTATRSLSIPPVALVEPEPEPVLAWDKPVVEANNSISRATITSRIGKAMRNNSISKAMITHKVTQILGLRITLVLLDILLPLAWELALALAWGNTKVINNNSSKATPLPTKVIMLNTPSLSQEPRALALASVPAPKAGPSPRRHKPPQEKAPPLKS